MLAGQSIIWRAQNRQMLCPEKLIVEISETKAGREYRHGESEFSSLATVDIRGKKYYNSSKS